MADDDPRLGAVLAQKYAITRMLGRGAFGAVYEATNLELEKRVAVKLVEPQYAAYEEIVARFRQEARAASRIESEHIVQVFDVGEDAAHGLFMVMELLRGEDLAARLDRELKLSPTVATHLAVQAARGLAKAHAAGVVHRDLKPANVFLCAREDGSILVKLVDFGISKLLGEAPQREEGARALTRVGTVVGTQNYMSPEQARGLPIDGRTDVWALGAVLFEMLAGVPAFAHDASYQETLIAIATGPEPRLGEVAPWVPPELAKVVDRALTRDLAQRIPDCETFAAMLSGANPNAARPRREESLYMDVAEESAAPARPMERAPSDARAHEVAAEPEIVPGRGEAPSTLVTLGAIEHVDPVDAGSWRGTIGAVLGVLSVLSVLAFAAWTFDRREGPPTSATVALDETTTPRAAPVAKSTASSSTSAFAKHPATAHPRPTTTPTSPPHGVAPKSSTASAR